MTLSKVFLLDCAVQNYAWGTVGLASEVASLVKSARSEYDVDNSLPYAELWMGTHPSGPSSIILPDVRVGASLSQHLQENPDLAGDRILGTYGGTDLPFLMKVLSVRTALSIQAHPDKVLAQELHRSRPDLYKDPNHKPELALALTPFDALCGFRPFSEISAFLKEVPELASLVSKDATDHVFAAVGEEHRQKKALKVVFSAAMTASKENVAQQLGLLVARVTDSEQQSDIDKLLLEIHQDFPGDIGCFGIYFLNHVHLRVGEALYLGANEPHAYLRGDCVEIMACSDNVVRAGLTPKFIDVQTLCSMLTYRMEDAASQLFPGTATDPYTTVYDPPVPDFTLAKIQVPSSAVTGYVLSSLDVASILLVVRGATLARESESSDASPPLAISRGSVLFVAAGRTLTLESTAASEDLLMFRGYC